MTTNIRMKEGALIVILPKEIDDHVTLGIRSELDRLISCKRIDQLIFDFAQTELMDSSGIGMILGRYKKLQFSKVKVQVINAKPRIRTTMELAGLHKVIKINEGEMV